MNIAPIEGIESGQTFSTGKTRNDGETGFVDRLKQAISEVNELQNNADKDMEKVTLGKLDIHEGMLALTEADMSLRLMVTVRNKIMDAYKEISRIS